MSPKMSLKVSLKPFKKHNHEPNLLQRKRYQSSPSIGTAAKDGLPIPLARRGAGAAWRKDLQRAARRGAAATTARAELHPHRQPQGSALLGTKHRERHHRPAQHAHGRWLPQRQRGGV